MLRSAFRSAIRPAVKSVFGHTSFPSGAILHFDANDGLFNAVEGKNIFQSSVLPTQYVRKADGSYAASTEVVDVINGEKWLRTCGAVTNLFSGDASIARSVSLTAQAYTLQVFGAGSVSCSYGTATVGSPLTFTAIVGSVTFTPTDATLWMITATAYPVPYTPPGTTMPASHATTTGGPWFALPQYDDAAQTRTNQVWAALDGEPDGAELVTNGGFDSATTGWSAISGGILSAVAGWMRITGLAGDATFAAAQTLTCIIGARYSVTWSARGTATPNLRLGTTATGTDIFVQDGAGLSKKTTFVATATTVHLTVYGLTADAYVEFDNISIQRIQPSSMTLATRVMMGVGSGDLANSTQGLVVDVNQFVGGGAGSGVQYFGVGSSADPRITRSTDGSVFTGPTTVSWAANSIILRATQVNTAGTRFRVGYMIEGVHTTMQWSHTGDESTWPLFDGSFNPSTIYRLMLGYNNTYPMWFSKIIMYRAQIDDAKLVADMGA